MRFFFTFIILNDHLNFTVCILFSLQKKNHFPLTCSIIFYLYIFVLSCKVVETLDALSATSQMPSSSVTLSDPVAQGVSRWSESLRL